MRRAELIHTIVQLDIKVKELEEALSELTFKTTYPPIYKYGDIIHIITNREVLGPDTKVEIKVLDCKIEKDVFRSINTTIYRWIYTVDAVEIGMYKLTELQIQQLKEGKIKINQV